MARVLNQTVPEKMEHRIGNTEAREAVLAQINTPGPHEWINGGA